MESFNSTTYSPALKGVAGLLAVELRTVVEDKELVDCGGSCVDSVKWWQW